MGIVGIKSFDRIATDDLTLYNYGFTSWLSMTTDYPRFPGKKSVYSQGAGYGPKFVFEATDDLIMGCAFRPNSLTTQPTLQLVSGGADKGYISGTADGSIRYVLDFSQKAISSPGLIKAAAWQYLEVRFYIHATSGVVEVRLDGKTVLSYSGDTYVNVSSVTEARFSTYGCRMCDCYVVDLNTAGHTDFLGPIVVDRLVPDADGTHEDWDPSTGSDNYAMVDDEDIDGDSTYVETDIDEAKDSYSLEDYTDQGDIFGVKLEATARKTDAGVANMRLFARLSGSEYDGPEEALAEGYGMISKIWEKNPDTAADWTETVLDNGEFGIAAMFTTTTTV